MKFVTEDDLRTAYKMQPFTTYEMAPDTRLTPSARQFLSDRGMYFYDDNTRDDKKNVPDIKQEQTKTTSPSSTCSGQDNAKTALLRGKIQSVEALFWMAGAEFLEKDICVAQSIVRLGKQLRGLPCTGEGSQCLEAICLKECTGIKAEHFSQWMADCFEITELHLPLEKTTGILTLYRLRCALRETAAYVAWLYDGGQEEMKTREETAAKLNQMIHALSQLFCAASGGIKCQRKD